MVRAARASSGLVPGHNEGAPMLNQLRLVIGRPTTAGLLMAVVLAVNIAATGGGDFPMWR